MKSETFVCFFWAFCFNVVAPYHYTGYPQGSYQQPSEWSSNPNYPQNPNPVYPLRQPVANYGPPQQFVNYVQHQNDPSFLEQKQEIIRSEHLQEPLPHQLQQKVGESQLDAIYEEKPAIVIPEPYLSIPAMNYDSYVVPQSSSWQQAPSSPVFSDSFVPQAPRQWSSLNSYQPGPPIPQPSSYPHWQYKTLQQQDSYGRSYDGQNGYNAPAPPPVQYAVQPDPQAISIDSAIKYRDLLAWKPEVKKYLESVSHKNRYIIIHPNGTVEHVEEVDDSLLGNSQLIKSSDIINDKDFQEKITNNTHENTVSNNIGSSTPQPDNQNRKTNINETHKNNELLPHLRPNVPKETKPVAVPVKEDHKNKHYYNLRHDKTNYVSNPVATTIPPVVKPVDHINYHRKPIYNPTPSQPHENRFVDQNNPAQSTPVSYNNNNYRNHKESHKSRTDIILTMRDENDKIYDSDSPLKEDNIKNYHKPLVTYPAKTKPQSSSTSSTTESVESNYYRSPVYDSSATNAKNNYYNPSEYRYSYTPPRPQDNYDDSKITAEYKATQATHNTTDTNPLDEAATTALPYQLYYPSNNFDNNNANPTPESSYLLDVIENQTPKQESNDDTSSNVQHYSGDDSPSTDKYSIDVVITTTDTSAMIQDNTDYGDNVADITNNEPNTSATQDTVSDDDDQQSKVESTTDNFYSTATTSDDIISLSSVEKGGLNEGSPTYIDTTNTGDEEEAKQQEPIDLIEKAKPNSASVDNEDVDFGNLKQFCKSVFCFQLDEDMLDKLYSEYDAVYEFDLKIGSEPIIEKTSRSFTYGNGTTLQEFEEITWEHENDVIPRQIKTTKITKNPGPEKARAPKKKSHRKSERKNDGAAAPKSKP